MKCKPYITSMYCACVCLLVYRFQQVGGHPNMGRDALLWVAVWCAVAGVCAGMDPSLMVSKVILTDVPSFGLLTLPPLVNGERWPRVVNYTIQVGENGTSVSGSFNTTDNAWNAVLLHTLLLPKVSHVGHAHFTLRLDPFRKISTTESLVLPAFISILPVLLTPVFCLLSRHIIIGLLLSLWVCASFVYGDPGTAVWYKASNHPQFVRICDTYFVNAINSDIHSRIIIFLIVVSGVIAMLQKSGGAMAIGLALKKKAGTARRGQAMLLVLTSLLSLDDRTAIMIAGQSLGPALASIGVPQERVATIVHSIAVCLASILPMSTWTAIQVGFVSSQYESLDISTNPWIACMNTLPYRVLPLVTIYCVLLMVVTGRDMGRLEKRERERSAGGGTVGMSIVDDESMVSELPVNYYGVVSYDSNCLEPRSNVTPRIANAVVPLMIVLFGTPLGMWLGGLHSLQSVNQEIPSIYIPHVFGDCTAVNALIWSTMAAFGVMVILTQVQKILTIEEAVSAWIKGFQNSLQPFLIIICVWAIELAITDLHTADYLSHTFDSLQKDSVPVITFLFTCILSYVCGSAYASMGILFPVVVPFAAHLGREIVLGTHFSPDEDLLVKCMGAIMGGSVLGDLASPLSETTLLTSLATGCSLSAHTSAQLQFMLSLCFVCIVCCVIPVSFRWMAIWESILLTLSVIAVTLWLTGASSESEGYLIGLFRRHRIKAPLLSRRQGLTQDVEYASSGYDSNDEVASCN